MKILLKLMVIIAEFIITLILTCVFNISHIVNVKIGYIIGAFAVFLTFLFFLILNIIDKTKKINKKDETIKELNLKISNLSDIKNKTGRDIGDRRFIMSLSQYISEPLKISLLEKAVNENNNVLAALVLANFYSSGIEHDKKYILQKNSEKAFEIYEFIKEYDDYGVSAWELGYAYENKQIESSIILSDSDRLQKAREYFEESAAKGYAKAYNSLGKFYYYGKGGLQKSFTDAMKNYSKAAELGDVYGIMNCGHISMKRYYETKENDCLEEAERYFNEAASYNNSEGLLHLGIIYEIKSHNDSKNILRAKEYYTKAVLSVKNQYSATAYYKLGKLLNNHPCLKNDSDVIDALKPIKYSDLSIECFTRAYQIFQNLDTSKERLDGQYSQCFNELIESFLAIK